MRSALKQLKKQVKLNQSYPVDFSSLRQVLTHIVPEQQKILSDINKQYGNQKVGEITVGQIIGGMRGMKGIVSDISTVDPDKGLLLKGHTIPELKESFPKAIHGADSEPLPEGVFWLLMTGQRPTDQNVESVQNEWKERGQLSDQEVNFITNLPRTMHPMTMLSAGLLYLQQESIFAQKYAEGKTHKREYWQYFYEDSMNLIAKIPRIAAIIYRHKYHHGDIIAADNHLDWAGNYSHMMGFSSHPMKECLRGYLAIHSDHEAGNVSAHTCHLVGSALADPYLSFASAVNGLAGPLHGLANQEVLRWLLEFTEEKGTNLSERDIEDYVDYCINNGKVVPGYGHAVLRNVDPRFTHQFEFASKYIKDDPLVAVLQKCSQVIPEKLKSYQKIKNPYPNVDCHSGVNLYALGLQEYEYYTVVFAVSRALGCMANLTWARALGLPIERPGSVDFKFFLDKFAK